MKKTTTAVSRTSSSSPPHSQFNEPPGGGLFEQIATQLEQRGYAILPDSLPEEIRESLLRGLNDTRSSDFRNAAIGRAKQQENNPFVRRDSIHWIQGSSPDTQRWLDWTRDLQTWLNRRLFLGLFSFESHYAYFQPGDFYKKHYDAFRGQANRVLSLVTYLNRGWQPDQGGELLLYQPDNENQVLARVTPAYGTLVIFLSEEFPHEVLPALRDRYSVAGWFRVNSSTRQRIDPPR